VISEEIRRVEPGEPAFELLKRLKQDGYNVLVDFTAVDRSALGVKQKGDGRAHVEEASAAAGPRFEVVWRLMKLDPESGMDQGRVALYAAVPEEPAVARARGLGHVRHPVRRPPRHQALAAL
jgi:NADH:ubiquinone oxidoreductase subunit C